MQMRFPAGKPRPLVYSISAGQADWFVIYFVDSEQESRQLRALDCDRLKMRLLTPQSFLLASKGLEKFLEKELSRSLVREEGLEPSRLSTYAPQTYVSTNSTTRAIGNL